jgi:hypothetical protein
MHVCTHTFVGPGGRHSTHRRGPRAQSQPQRETRAIGSRDAPHHLTNQEAIMAARRSSRLIRIRARFKQIWSELDYANRRMFDIRTREYFMQDARKKDSRARAARRRAVAAH